MGGVRGRLSRVRDRRGRDAAAGVRRAEAALVLFVTHSAGYFLGEITCFASRGQISVQGMLAWGLVYGLGFGAGIGYAFYAFRPKG